MRSSPVPAVSSEDCDLNGKATTLPPAVDAALRALFDAFSDAALSDDFSGCIGHCHTAEYVEFLRTVLPSNIPDDDIFSLVFDLTTVLGSARDVAHFVPALVSAQIRGVMVEDWLLFERIKMIPSEQWTTRRRDALVRAYEAAFREGCGEYDELGKPEVQAAIRAMLARVPGAESPAVQYPV